MAKYTITLIALGLLIFATYSIFRRRTPGEKLQALAREVRSDGGLVFQTYLEGRPAAFLVSKCAVYLLDVTGRKVRRTKVLKTGFYFGLTTCLSQKIEAQDGFVVVFLENRAIGAGGGNTSGGTYRSRDGSNWEKKMGERWVNVEEAQN